MQDPKRYRSPFRSLPEAGRDVLFSEENRQWLLAYQAERHSAAMPCDTEAIPFAPEELSQENWGHHIIIWKHPGLLRFLEEDEFDYEAVNAAYSYRYKPSFVQYLSRYYAFSFQNTASALLHHPGDFTKADQLMHCTGFLLPQHEAYAYEPMRGYLTAETIRIQNLRAYSTRDTESLDFLFLPAWTGFVNRMPAFLADARTELAESIYQFLLQHHERGGREYVRTALVQLHQVDVPESLRARIEETQSILTRRAQNSAPGTVNNKATSIWLFLVLGSGVLGLFIALSNYVRSKKPQTSHYVESVREESYGSGTSGIPSDSPASQDLASSTNERNFKHLMAYLSAREQSGTRISLSTGDNPFGDISAVPPPGEDGHLTVRNNTSHDAVLLYFTSDNLLTSGHSRLYAAFIARGEQYSFTFRPNFGRINILFGDRWTHMDETIRFKMEAPSFARCRRLQMLFYSPGMTLPVLKTKW